MSTTSNVDDVPVQGKITEEMMAAAQALVGMRLLPGAVPHRCDGRSLAEFLQRHRRSQPALSRYRLRPRDAIRHAAHASDVPDRQRLDRALALGLPRRARVYAGSDWEVFPPRRPGDRSNCIERIVGVEEKGQSKFSGRLILQYTEGNFYNQRFELIAKVLGWCTRHERRAAREKASTKDHAYQYSPEELDAIDAAVAGEEAHIRGGTIRNWEDVREGETLARIARGPLSLQDVNAFLIGSAHTRGAHGTSCKRR